MSCEIHGVIFPEWKNHKTGGIWKKYIYSWTCEIKPVCGWHIEWSVALWWGCAPVSLAASWSSYWLTSSPGLGWPQLTWSSNREEICKFMLRIHWVYLNIHILSSQKRWVNMYIQFYILITILISPSIFRFSMTTESCFDASNPQHLYH